MYKKIVCERLKEARQKSKLTQKEVSNLLGITSSALSKYENAELEPNTEIIGKLAVIYEVSIDWLFGLGREKTEEQTKKERQEEKIRQEILKRLG